MNEVPAPLDGTQEAYDRRFAANIQRLRAFVAENGRAPRAAETDNCSGAHLGRWLWSVGHDRVALNPERIAALDAAFPQWRQPNPASSFAHLIARLKRYQSGHGRLPYATETDGEPGVHLGRFLSRARRGRRITEEELRALTDAFPGWQEQDRLTVRFGEQLAALVAFIEKHGVCPTPGNTDETTRSLMIWMHNIRAKSERLSTERLQALEAAAPCWRGSCHDPFERHLTRLRAFIAQHGRTPKPGESDDQEDAHLGIWLSRISTGSGLTPARASALAEIPGVTLAPAGIRALSAAAHSSR